jgi:hypothetical protein
LPGFPERPHRRIQGELPVCPTLAPLFSLFQGVATPHEGYCAKSLGAQASMPACFGQSVFA